MALGPGVIPCSYLPREKARTLVFGRFRVTDDADYFRMAAGPKVL
jgi:hypothetical protein